MDSGSAAIDGAVSPCSAAPPEKPPTSTFTSERFIATHMIWVRISPDAPTIVPAMISRALLSANPVAAAASPDMRVEQADHDRHVGTADRQHQRDAHRPRCRATSASTSSDDTRRVLDREHRDEAGHEARQQQHAHQRAAGRDAGRALDRAAQLEFGQDAAGQGHRADQHRQHQRGGRRRPERRGRGPVPRRLDDRPPRTARSRPAPTRRHRSR